MIPRSRERIGGVLMMAVGIALALYNWHLHAEDGVYYVKSSFLGPTFAVIGAGLLVFPSPKSERALQGLPDVHGIQVITRRWWGVLIAAMAVGGLNLFVLNGGLAR